MMKQFFFLFLNIDQFKISLIDDFCGINNENILGMAICVF